MELVVEMLTAGLAFDCPHVWDTQTLIDLNDGRSLWTTHTSNWVEVQQYLSRSIQGSPGIYGMVYTTSTAETTSRFRVDLCDEATIWSVVMEGYQIGAYHRTLSYMPNDASILMVVRTPYINDEVMRGRFKMLNDIMEKASMKRIIFPESDHLSPSSPAWA